MSLFSTAVALDRPSSGIDWLDDKQFPYWEEAMRLGNPYKFVSWVTTHDPVKSAQVVAHLTEFRTVFAKVQKELNRVPPAATAASEAAAKAAERTAKPKKDHSADAGWIKVKDPDSGSSFYYHVESGQKEWSNGTAVGLNLKPVPRAAPAAAPATPQQSRAEKEARSNGQLSQSKRLNRRGSDERSGAGAPAVGEPRRRERGSPSRMYGS
jgi:hypothetical protein